MTEPPFEHGQEPTAGFHRLQYTVLIGLVAVFLGVSVGLAYVLATRPAPPAASTSVTKVVGGVRSTILKDPLGVAVYNGKFYVTDAKNRRVVVFLLSGESIFDFNGEGHGPTGLRLVYPAGIAINSRGEVYVADSGAGKVVIFSESGRALRTLPLPKRRKIALKPLAVAIDEQDDVYVSEAKTGSVYRFDRDGKLLQTLGDKKLAFANGIAIRDNGDIYVADSNNQRILVFNQFGKLIQRIGHRRGDKSFLPRGLTLDKGGDLLVADTLGSRIVELNETGHEIDSWGSPGQGREQMMFPNGIAYADGLLYIVDRGNNRVVIWQHLP